MKTFKVKVEQKIVGHGFGHEERALGIYTVQIQAETREAARNAAWDYCGFGPKFVSKVFWVREVKN